MRFVDTNVLLYSISRDPAEAPKRQVAIELLQAADLALSVQVLQEFYVQATRATRQDAIPHALAAGLVRTWGRFTVQDVTFDVLLGGLDIKVRHGLSYWDAAIVAAARLLGCNELLSEDLQDGRSIDGILLRNPFREPPATSP
jgi:predicted nucleic acid-binding protein